MPRRRVDSVYRGLAGLTVVACLALVFVLPLFLASLWPVCASGRGVEDTVLRLLPIACDISLSRE